MALLDPSDHARRIGGDHQPTARPMVCLLSGFAFIVVVALLVHLAFSLVG